jgi:putative transposase
VGENRKKEKRWNAEQEVQTRTDRDAARDRGGRSQRQDHPQACREAGITEQSYYRWRKEFGGLRLDQAKRLKEQEKENLKLKRLVAELSLEKQILKDVAERNF